MTILHRAWSKYQDDGFISLFKTGVSFLIDKTLNWPGKLLRSLTPVKWYAVWNNVKIPPEVAPKRRLIDEYVTLIRADYHESEDGEVESHKEFTQPGDTLIIIGGGSWSYHSTCCERINSKWTSDSI